jgi:LmbE family N-acetylglucosaminyl deacetylase
MRRHDAYTTSCADALAHWQRSLPGGVAGMLRRVVSDLRMRRPRVVITLDPRDDPQASHHGHHKAVGVIVEAAARLAADPRVPGGEPLAIEELLTTAPRDLPEAQTVNVPVEVAARVHALGAYPSQFTPEELAVDPIAQRPREQFVLRWRAVGAPPAASSARVLDLLR